MVVGAGDEIATQKKGAMAKTIMITYLIEAEVQKFNLSRFNGEEMRVTTVNSSSDQFVTVRTIKTTRNAMQDSGDLLATTKSGNRAGLTKSSATRARMTLSLLQAHSKALSRQRDTAKSSTGTKLPPTNRLMPLYMTPLVKDGISVDEIMTWIFHGRVNRSNGFRIEFVNKKRLFTSNRRTCEKSYFGTSKKLAQAKKS